MGYEGRVGRDRVILEQRKVHDVWPSLFDEDENVDGRETDRLIVLNGQSVIIRLSMGSSQPLDDPSRGSAWVPPVVLSERNINLIISTWLFHVLVFLARMLACQQKVMKSAKNRKLFY
jgi:hypothetical protein